MSVLTSALPEAVDLIISGADVLTFDASGTVIRDGLIAMSGSTVHWVGLRKDAVEKFRARTVIEARGAIALPGLVDAHYHTAQQLLRGKLFEMSRRQRLRNPPWKNYYLPFEAMLEPQDVYLSGLLGYADMISCGTTCFAEAGGPHPDAMAEAAEEVGIRGFVAHSTIDTGEGVPPALRMSTQQALELNEALVKRRLGHGRVQAWLSLRQLMLCSEELTQGMADLAHRLGVKIHLHLAEGTYEVDFALEQWGRRPVEHLAEARVLDANIHAAHSVLLTNEEVDLYRTHKVSACHCAFNNYHIGSPRLLQMWRSGIPIGLGTDGAGAWGPLDIFQVAHVARIGQQCVVGTPYHFRGVTTGEEMLDVAVRGGARALGIEDRIGSIAPGKRADMILVESRELEQAPNYDPLFTAANTVIGRDVRTVIVDGRVVMKDRELQTLDVERIRALLSERHPGLMARFEAAVA